MYDVIGVRFKIGVSVVGVKSLHHFAVEIEQTLGICGIPHTFSACLGAENEIFVLRYARGMNRCSKPEVSVITREGNIYVIGSPAVNRRLLPVL